MCYDPSAIGAEGTTIFVSTNHGDTGHVTPAIFIESYLDIWPPNIRISQRF